ncbi:MAG: PEP-utilizing enzyme [SAR202 cluster bacterium]|nr:PEP-utilizing enzyme [SAR202 cluster bacterium]MDP6514672.1 PEP-utilizing enzyme [SAR202 cluster bacterium]
MTSPLTTIYECSDGADFPVDWANPEQRDHRWSWDSSHWPNPLKPFDAAVWLLSEVSCKQAHSDAGIPLHPILRDFLVPNGFLHWRRVIQSDEENSQIQQFTDRMGGILGAWEQFCQPRTEERCTWLRESGDEPSTPDLVAAYGYAFHMTMVSLQTIMLSRQLLIDFLVADFGEESEILATELTAGGVNETLMADQALWEIAQIARRSEPLTSIIIENEPEKMIGAISDTDDGTQFLTAFEEYIQYYGLRTSQWESAAPTFREQPEAPLGFIKHAVMNDVPAPLEVQQNVANEMDKLAVDVETKLGSDDEKRARFRELLAATKPWVTVRENRAFWQLLSYGSLRVAMLRRGQRLVDADAIDQVEDIFFLEPEEVDRYLANTADSAKALVEQRRQEWEFWSTKTPPEFVGQVDESTQPESEGDVASEKVLRGIGASRGVVTARARVIMDLAEAANFQSGEILVCVTTAPPWTILFTKAVAVVIDAGGVLSHASIASREYGIPCVAATGNGTSLIKDGMLITVDGAEGTVTIED